MPVPVDTSAPVHSDSGNSHSEASGNQMHQTLSAADAILYTVIPCMVAFALWKAGNRFSLSISTPTAPVDQKKLTEKSSLSATQVEWFHFPPQR